MTVETMTLTDFLLARIAEDEIVGERVLRTTRTAAQSALGNGVTRGVVAAHPARILAECEAKRRIVEALDVTTEFESDGNAWWTAKLLALPYADHPDFRPEWQPE